MADASAMTDSTPQVATFAFGKFGANVAVSKARLEVAMTQSTGEPETCAEDIETEPLLESGEESKTAFTPRPTDRPAT